MEKVRLLDKLKNRNNKGMGLTIILTSLLMIFSLTLFAYMANPLFLIQLPLFIVFGYSGTFVFWIFAIIFASWYYNVLHSKWFTKKRVIMLMVFIFSVMLIFNMIIVTLNISQPINEIASLKEYYNAAFIEPLLSYFKGDGDGKGMWIVHRVNTHDVYIMGALLPLITWLIGGWWYNVLSIIIVLLLALYALYVVIVDEYTIVFSALAFWSNDKNAIKVVKKAESLDLNQPTEEFELNFEQDEYQKEKLELIEKVRKNMDTKDYKELSNKIASEKDKMVELRNKIVAKLKNKKEEREGRKDMGKKRNKEINSHTRQQRDRQTGILGTNRQTEIRGTERNQTYKQTDTPTDSTDLSQ